MTRRSLFTKLAGLLTILPFVGKGEAQTPRFYRPPHWNPGNKLSHNRGIPRFCRTPFYLREGTRAYEWREEQRYRAHQHGWHGTSLFRHRGAPIWAFEGDHIPDGWGHEHYERSRRAYMLRDGRVACRSGRHDTPSYFCPPREAYAWVMADPLN